MPGINDALQQIAKLRPGEKICYTRIAKDARCDPVTLARHHQGVQADRDTKNLNQLKVSPQQETELVQYIIGLTERSSPPTRQMIINFVRGLAKIEVSQTWVTRFLHRHRDLLTNRYTNPMASVRHAADSYDKYRAYFDVIEYNVQKYDILPQNRYNMDEKGFMAGVLGKQKRVFSKASWTRNYKKQSSHDGSREWITLLACIGADGTVLPPGLIFSADSKTPQSSWLSDVDKKKHSVYTTVTPSGWSNDDTGLGWVEQVFEPLTRDKARRKWRLLLMDGHGSHVTMEFLTFCVERRILVLIYPPHSTQTLQPLDVACFSPLAQAYTKALGIQLQKQQNLVAFKKEHFFGLFWEAWKSSFTKELVKRAFEVVGIEPVNPSVILDRFNKSDPEAAASQAYTQAESARSVDKLWRETVKDTSAEEAKKLRTLLHQTAAQNELLKIERDDLQKSLKAVTKPKSQNKALPLIQRKETHSKTQWWSPRGVNEAQHLLKIFKQEQRDKELEKVTTKQARASNKLLKDKLDAVRKQRIATEHAEKVERARLKAEETKAKKAAKSAAIAEKSTQLPNQAKNKASQKSQQKISRIGGGSSGRRRAVAQERSLTPPPKKATTGRVVKPTYKLR
jgi:hypothetical protein